MQRMSLVKLQAAVMALLKRVGSNWWRKITLSWVNRRRVTIGDPFRCWPHSVDFILARRRGNFRQLGKSRSAPRRKLMWDQQPEVAQSQFSHPVWAICVDFLKYGAAFSNNLRETFSYKKILKHRFYLILKVMDKYAACFIRYTFYGVIGRTYSSKIS